MAEARQPSLRTAQIGRCGELLVQYRLLLRGIESAPMTTDSGVDLVAYVASTGRPATIQVKTNLRPKPGGGKGRLALDWWLAENCPAQIVALVDLASQNVWLFLWPELKEKAQQHPLGRYHFYMYTEPEYHPQGDMPAHVREFEQHLIELRANDLLGTGQTGIALPPPIT